MAETDLKESIQSLIDLQADAEQRGYARGFDAGWAACKARYHKQRAEQGERLDGARTSEELLEACKAYLYGTHEGRECESMMRAAIAKAESAK